MESLEMALHLLCRLIFSSLVPMVYFVACGPIFRFYGFASPPPSPFHPPRLPLIPLSPTVKFTLGSGADGR